MNIANKAWCFTIAAAFFCGGCAASNEDDVDSSEGALAAPTSGYTSLVNGDPTKPWYKECRQVEWYTEDTPEYGGQWDCGGQDGYSLFVSDGDGRQWMDVRAPGGKIFDLHIQQHAGGGFGYFGPNAEWRGTFASSGQVHPSALIVRYILTEWDENYTHEIEHHHLLVAKLSKDASCIYADVDGGQAHANEKARVEADKAASITCPAEEPAKPLDIKYTSIEPQDCHAAGGSLDCGGVEDFAFLQKKQGSASTVSIRTPDGKVHAIPAEVPIAGDVTATNLGPKAEWHGYASNWDGKESFYPRSVIYRYKRTSKQHHREHHTLVVVKVTSSNPCVYAIVEASKQSDVANRLAAEIADRAERDVCPAEVPKFPAMAWSNPDPAG
jgi:hypothetical protein